MTYKPGHCKECGHDEFCTDPNWYEIHCVNARGELECIRSEPTDDKCNYYCRDCGATHEESDDYPESSAGREEDKILAWFRAWVDATESGGLGKVHSLIADDAVFLVPGVGRMDKAAFASAVTRTPETLAQFEFEGGAEVEEVRVSGDTAYLWTRIKFSILEKKEKKKTAFSGHSLSVLENRGGCWVLIRDANTVTPEGKREQ